jgi:hypothetical protein
MSENKKQCLDSTTCFYVTLCCCLCLQIPQQPFQRLLVAVMLFPSGEVADMARVADERRPAACYLHGSLK